MHYVANMNLIRKNTPNKWTGGNTCKEIIIHWWDDPAKNPTLNGVVARFLDPAVRVSAHYVVSGDTVVQMCEETDRAWHAIKANNFGIGIEIDPKTPGNTYKTLGELVRSIRSRRGNIPLKPHHTYAATRCSGTIDIARIDREAAINSEGEDMVTQRGLDVIYRLRLGRAPNQKEVSDNLGKTPFDRVDELVVASNEYKERVAKVKAAKALLNEHRSSDMRV